MKRILASLLFCAGCTNQTDDNGSLSGSLRGGVGTLSAQGPSSCLDPADQIGAGFGTVVAAGRDINKDGFADLIVGAPLWNSNPYTDEGRAWVYFGSATGPSGTPWTADPANQALAAFGSAAAAGDVNGDGFADVIVGAPKWNGQANGEGRGYVYHGSASGLPSSPTATRDPTNQLNASFAKSMAAGDFNGDAYVDVVFGAPDLDAGGVTDRGEAYAFYGSATGIGTTAAWTTSSLVLAGAPQLAKSLAVADVNGDNYDDIIAGVPGYDHEATDEGAVFVFLGSSTGPTLPPLIYEPTNQAGAQFGASVAAAGDVDCTGIDAFIVGAPGWDGQQINEGRAFLYLGGDDGPAASFAWSVDPTDQIQAAFGTSVASAGDLNGDGHSEVLVGAPGTGDGGRVYVYGGKAGGLTTLPLRIEVSSQVGAGFGASVAGAGDNDGDGLADYGVGVPGWDSSTHVDEGKGCWFPGTFAACGDATCEAAEDACNCPADCGVDTCGNSVCCPPETGTSCPADCPGCGNGRCDSGEDGCSCAGDCGTECGDHCCNGGETSVTCRMDCGECGDGSCKGDETLASCPEDCDTTCGDGVCTEGCASCALDCGAVCGDGCCGPLETRCSCAQDCGSICGDDCCNGTDSADPDSPDYCPMDCGTLSPPGKLGTIPGTTVVVTNSTDANADGLPESVTLQGGSCGSPLTVPLGPGQSTTACGICIAAGTAADDVVTVTPGCAGLAFGGPGHDELIASTVGNLLYGGPGNDRLQGGPAVDRLVGDDGADSLSGGPGNDLLFGGKGNDALHGDAGDDLGYGGDGNDYLDGATGNDTLFGGYNDDCLAGGDGNDLMRTSNGNDTALGGCGHDVIRSEGGNDYVKGDGACKANNWETKCTCAAADDCGATCGDGCCGWGETPAGCPSDCACDNDGVCESGEKCSCADCKVCGDGCCAGGEATSCSWDCLCDGDHVCEGAPGMWDCIDAGSGSDRVKGGAGDDVIWGGTGNDDLHGDDGNDKITLGEGINLEWAYGDNGNDIIDAYWVPSAPYWERDYVYGGGGSDTAYYNDNGAGNQSTDILSSIEDQRKNQIRDDSPPNTWDKCACMANADCLGGETGGAECSTGTCTNGVCVKSYVFNNNPQTYAAPNAPPSQIPASPPFIVALGQASCSDHTPCFKEGYTGPEFKFMASNLFNLQDHVATYVRDCLGSSCRPAYARCLPSGFCRDGTTSCSPSSDDACPGDGIDVENNKCVTAAGGVVGCGTACGGLDANCQARLENGREVEEVLEETKRLGIKVVRTWGFNDLPGSSTQAAIQLDPEICPASNTCPHASGVSCTSGSTMCLNFSTYALQALDYVIWRAQQKGLRVIMPFGNWWRDYGGIPQYLRWHGCTAEQEKPVQTDEDEDSGLFFQLPRFVNHYRALIKHIVFRRNSFIDCPGGAQRCETAWNSQTGGRPYRDEPTIMAWEMMNEPRGDGLTWFGNDMVSWISNLAVFLGGSGSFNGIDLNHLITNGEEGFEVKTTSSGNGTVCTTGIPVETGYPTLWANDYDCNSSDGTNSTTEQILYQGGYTGSAFCKNLYVPQLSYASVHLYLDDWGICGNGNRAREIGIGWMKDHAARAKAYNKPIVVGEVGLRANNCFTGSSCRTGTGCWTRDQRRCIYDSWMEQAFENGIDGFAPWGYRWDGGNDKEYTWYCPYEDMTSSADCVDYGTLQQCPPGGDSEPRYYDIVKKHAGCGTTGCCFDPTCNLTGTWNCGGPLTCP